MLEPKLREQLQAYLQRLTDAVLEHLQPDRPFVAIAQGLVARSPMLMLGDHLEAKRLLKDKEISEDDERRALEQLQRLTDGTIAEIDRLVSGKEAEILAV